MKIYIVYAKSKKSEYYEDWDQTFKIDAASYKEANARGRMQCRLEKIKFVKCKQSTGNG